MAMASPLGKSSAPNGEMLTNNKRASIAARYAQTKALGKWEASEVLESAAVLALLLVVVGGGDDGPTSKLPTTPLC